MNILTIHFHPEAEEEYNSAARWYEQQKPGLDANFQQYVDEAIQQIFRHPEMHPVVYNYKRRIVVKRFPYAIYYEIRGRELRILFIQAVTLRFGNRANPNLKPAI